MQLSKQAQAEERPLEQKDLPIPEPQWGQVRLQIKVCGVCHTDLHYREGAINDDFPFLLGHEDAGVIEKVGDNVKKQIKDKQLMELTTLMYGRIPKKKERNAPPEEWILSKDNILGWQNDLGAVATTRFKSTAPVAVMAAAGKGVHVVKSPDHRHVVRDRAKERRIVSKKRNPVQMHNVRVD